MTGDDEGGAEATRRGWARLLEPDMLVALAAVLLGLCALFVSLAQVRIMRQEQHATVWPVLQIGRTYSQGETVGVIVLNPGIGPAVVREVTVTVDGEAVRSWAEALSRLQPSGSFGAMSRSSISGRIIPAGETVQALLLRDAVVADAVRGEMHRLRVSVCYCSVYDTCWRAESSFGDRDPVSEPVETDTCSVDAPPFVN